MNRSSSPPLITLKVAGSSVLGLLLLYAYKGLKLRLDSAPGSVEIDDPPPLNDRDFVKLIETLTRAPQREGNRVEVLRNGCEIFPALLDAIASATRSICFSSYIWWAGGAAGEIGAALAARARQNVSVRVLLDAWGSAKLDRSVVSMLEEAGAEVVWFRPLRWYQLGKANNRMHRRILVIDGSVAFAGGVGIAEDWEGDCDLPTQWRETHVRVEGPAVRDLLGAFLENWAEATGRVPAAELQPDLEPIDGGVPVLVARSSPTGGITATGSLFAAAIGGCEERLWITTAYFAPQKNYIDALAAAAGRGVDVRILVNGRPIDKQVVRRAGQSSYGRLLAAGVRIFEYQRARLHAKVILVDDEWANVGSANFDNRSIALEEEVNLCIADRKIVAELENHFADDLEDAREIDPERWRHRPVRQRLRERAANLVRHSL